MARILSVVLVVLFLGVINGQMSQGSINPPSASCPYSYVGQNGAYNWGTMCNGLYSTCAGDSQSPIDLIPIYAVNNSKLGPIKTNYTDSPALISWNGYSLIITPTGKNTDFGSLATIPNLPYLFPNASSYKFKQATLHAVSEHTIYGLTYDAELHLVHEAVKSDGSVSNIVLCYFYAISSDGYAARLLDPIVDMLRPLAKNYSASGMVQTVSANVTSMPWLSYQRDQNSYRPLNGSYWHYNGSKTTPPCTKDYIHFIFADPRILSQAQFNIIFKVLNNNWRPLQRQNSRVVMYYDATNPVTASSGSPTLTSWASAAMKLLNFF